MSESPVAARILHVTDPHLFADADGSLRGVVTDTTLKAVVEHIARSEWPADLVAMTGDVIQDDTAEAYARFRDIIAPLGLPVYCVPGNHDVRSLMRDLLHTAPFHYCSSLRIRNWLIAGIDSCVDNDAGGQISAAELSRLAEILATTDATHVAICLHHPPLMMQSRWLDQVGLKNADEFLDLVCTAGNVRVTLFGHVHQPFDKVHRNVRIVGTPSTCAQFKPRSDTFALDHHPPAYRRVSLYEDGNIRSELIWLETDE
jgi:Icc protein